MFSEEATYLPDSNRLGVYFAFFYWQRNKFIYIMTTCVVGVSFDGIDSCVKSICDVVLQRFDYLILYYGSFVYNLNVKTLPEF